MANSKEDDFEWHVFGNLECYLARDAWAAGMNDGDRSLGLDLIGPEWEAIFSKTLGSPEYDFNLSEEQNAKNFHRRLVEYPMLSRIRDMYGGAGWKPEELAQLRDECLKVQERAKHPKAREGLDKLVKACDEAMKAKLCLVLVPD